MMCSSRCYGHGGNHWRLKLGKERGRQESSKGQQITLYLLKSRSQVFLSLCPYVTPNISPPSKKKLPGGCASFLLFSISLVVLDTNFESLG